MSGTFFSPARNRTVGYTIAYPPGHRAGDALPLVVMLHGYGGNHTNALAGMSPAQAVALHVGGRPLLPWPWSPSTAATATGTRIPATTPWPWSSTS